MRFLRQRFSENSCRYRLGNPFETGAVIAIPQGSSSSPVDLPYLSVTATSTTVQLTRPLLPGDRIFGLGEMLGPLNKRGKRYRCFAKDDPHHSPEKASLYSSHPILFFDGEERFALFIDYPGEIIFDIGYQVRDQLSITIRSQDVDLYVIEAATLPALTKEYLTLTGKPYLPPRWAFGYQQCRYSYPTESKVREVWRSLRTHQIPCDVLYIDIDYMDGFKAFTIDEKNFPDLKALVAELKADGIQTIPIIDPGIKVEPGYLPYDSGVAGNHFCLKEDGTPFVGAVWPGMTHFPDFLNPETQLWWGSLYQPLFECGLEHFWNDMNEPAIFFTPESLSSLKNVLGKYSDVTDLGTEPVGILGELHSFWAQEQFYREFFHRPTAETRVRHDEVHNLYGSGMAKSTAMALHDRRPSERYFLLSRSSYAGDHRFTTIWMGDNTSWWEHMLAHIRMLISLNMIGFAFSGADVGGFCGDSSAELLTRWTALGVFTPLFRNHSTKGSREQEPYAFDEQTTIWCRDLVQLRYALLPFLYTEFCSARDALAPCIKPLMFEYGGERVKDIEDQFLWGSRMMVAPVHVQNAQGRYVHLPEHPWLQWNAAQWERRAARIMPPGDHYVEAALPQIPVFLRPDTLIPLIPPAPHTGALSLREITVLGFVNKGASYTIRWDDGTSWGIDAGAETTVTLSVLPSSTGWKFLATVHEHPAAPLRGTRVQFEVYDEEGICHRGECTL